MNRLKLLFYCVAVCMAVTTGAYGQATYGTIFGTVTDSSGAPLPNVKVTVISQDRGITFSASSNDSGNYSKTQLPAGGYEVDFERQGFQRIIQKDVAVSVDRSTRVDAQLQVGEVQTQIEVTAALPGAGIGSGRSQHQPE